MPAAPVPEAAMPGVRAGHGPDLAGVEKCDRRTPSRPLPDAGFRNPDPARAVGGLNPAGLLGLGIDAVAARKIEQESRRIPQECDKAFAGGPVPRDDRVGIGARQRRDHLAVVAPGGAETGLGRLEDDGADAGLGKMQGGGEPGEARPDHDRIATLVARESGKLRPGRCHRMPERRRRDGALGAHRAGITPRARPGTVLSCRANSVRSGDQVGSEAKVGVGTVCSTRPVMSIM